MHTHLKKQPQESNPLCSIQDIRARSEQVIPHLGVVSGWEGGTAAVAEKNLTYTVHSHIQGVVGQVAVVPVEHDNMDRCAKHHTKGSALLALVLKAV